MEKPNTSCKSSSRNANVRQSVCQSVTEPFLAYKYLSLSLSLSCSLALLLSQPKVLTVLVSFTSSIIPALVVGISANPFIFYKYFVCLYRNKMKNIKIFHFRHQLKDNNVYTALEKFISYMRFDFLKK